ncbi:MAG: 4Fe-4S binding protein [Candidatus Schekmanbacteria bacterium]|nr:4Fe-4S binding protein [Candidatus Schekmanbacteria bacterium]
MRIDRAVCVGCGGCVNQCPRLAIRFIDNKSYIDQMACVECGTCRAVCGVDAIYSDCRFTDIVVMNYESNPFCDDIEDFFEVDINFVSEKEH